MKKILANGVTLVGHASNEAGFEVSLTFGGGHQTEPKLGLAATYENIVSRQARGELQAVYGGNITSFITSGNKNQLNKKLNELWLACVHPTIDDYEVELATSDIVQHTYDLAGVPMRQCKLAYKHTAFGQDKVVWDTSEYMKKVSELTAEDVQGYIDRALVGKNIILSFVGSEIGFAKFEKLAEKLFGSLPAGERTPLKNYLYTGGYQEIKGNGMLNVAMFGWNVSRSGNFAETNVLMSMLSARLERSLAPLAVSTEVKIAGYFGFRTLRICVSCVNNENFAKAVDIVCDNVRRITYDDASDRRLETSKQRAMSERLAISNEALPRSVQAAWLLLKRGIEYDNNKCIANIWRTTAGDVRDKALDIFTSEMTCVIYGNYHSSKEEILRKMELA